MSGDEWVWLLIAAGTGALLYVISRDGRRDR